MNSPTPQHGPSPPDEMELMEKMAVSAMLAIFERFHPLEALRLILEGMERKRFPLQTRPHLENLKWEIQRSFDSRSTFLVSRIMNDLRGYLIEFTDEESRCTLEGMYKAAQVLRNIA